jgi:hypothetical protein
MTCWVTIRIEETIEIDDAMNLDHAEQLAKERFDATAHSPEVIDSWVDEDMENYCEF